MTVADLKGIIQDLPDDLPVCVPSLDTKDSFQIGCLTDTEVTDIDFDGDIVECLVIMPCDCDTKHPENIINLN